MEAFINPTGNTRLGIHYFPDTFHFSENDLKTWLPRLKSLGIRWLTLVAPNDRAIPEMFLKDLLEAGIEPILHFQLPFVFPALTENLQLLLNAYAKWGVHYVVFFDRPNLRSAWPSNTWAQADLVERFLDIFLPLTEAATTAGLIPVFPPLEPGGDYWDTAFLRAALQGIQRRGHPSLLETLVLSAYAGIDDRPINWGAGGPECWPGSRPYFTPAGQQDQRGFYIFDWYLALAMAVLGDTRPMFLFGAGKRLVAGPEATEAELEIHAQENLVLAQLLMGDADGFGNSYSKGSFRGIENNALQPVPPEVLSCNFWLLAADSHQPQAGQAWFQPEGSPLPVVAALAGWMKHNSRRFTDQNDATQRSVLSKRSPLVGEVKDSQAIQAHPIAHYLLLPTYEWGISEWQLEAIKPFIKRYRPTVGFSIEEASLAVRVTVIGGPQTFPEESLEELVRSGCQVDLVSGDGTSIATKLAIR